MLNHLVLVRWPSVLLVTGMLAACATEVVAPPVVDHSGDTQEGLSRAAVVATGAPRLDRSKPSTISWLAVPDVVGQHPVLEENALRSVVSERVSQQIVRKGYAVVPDGGDFQLTGVLVLAGTRDQETVLRESGGLDPGLAGYDALPGKGSLVLELRQGRVTRWKGSVQIYLAPHFDQQVALRRIEYAIAQLLATWP